MKGKTTFIPNAPSISTPKSFQLLSILNIDIDQKFSFTLIYLTSLGAPIPCTPASSMTYDVTPSCWLQFSYRHVSSSYIHEHLVEDLGRDRGILSSQHHPLQNYLLHCFNPVDIPFKLVQSRSRNRICREQTQSEAQQRYHL